MSGAGYNYVRKKAIEAAKAQLSKLSVQNTVNTGACQPAQLSADRTQATFPDGTTQTVVPQGLPGDYAIVCNSVATVPEPIGSFLDSANPLGYGIQLVTTTAEPSGPLGPTIYTSDAYLVDFKSGLKVHVFNSGDWQLPQIQPSGYTFSFSTNDPLFVTCDASGKNLIFYTFYSVTEEGAQENINTEALVNIPGFPCPSYQIVTEPIASVPTSPNTQTLYLAYAIYTNISTSISSTGGLTWSYRSSVTVSDMEIQSVSTPECNYTPQTISYHNLQENEYGIQSGMTVSSPGQGSLQPSSLFFQKNNVGNFQILIYYSSGGGETDFYFIRTVNFPVTTACPVPGYTIIQYASNSQENPHEPYYVIESIATSDPLWKQYEFTLNPATWQVSPPQILQIPQSRITDPNSGLPIVPSENTQCYYSNSALTVPLWLYSSGEYYPYFFFKDFKFTTTMTAYTDNAPPTFYTKSQNLTFVNPTQLKPQLDSPYAFNQQIYKLSDSYFCYVDYSAASGPSIPVLIYKLQPSSDLTTIYTKFKTTSIDLTPPPGYEPVATNSDIIGLVFYRR